MKHLVILFFVALLPQLQAQETKDKASVLSVADKATVTKLRSVLAASKTAEEKVAFFKLALSKANSKPLLVEEIVKLVVDSGVSLTEIMETVLSGIPKTETKPVISVFNVLGEKYPAKRQAIAKQLAVNFPAAKAGIEKALVLQNSIPQLGGSKSKQSGQAATVQKETPTRKVPVVKTPNIKIPAEDINKVDRSGDGS
ncbi:MAG: hypothetical protein NE334_15075 [Lentisphaeraceae bacterium]|nr:hypothetical protein [Lentisphaeraceae bacterium]